MTRTARASSWTLAEFAALSLKLVDGRAGRRVGTAGGALSPPPGAGSGRRSGGRPARRSVERCGRQRPMGRFKRRREGHMTDDAYMLVLDKNGPTGSEWTVRKCPEGIDLKFRKDWYPTFWQAWAAATASNKKWLDQRP